MKNFIIIFSVFVSSFLLGQITKSDLIGTWQVKSVSYNFKVKNQEDKPKMETLKKMFLQSSFVFRNNNLVDFNFPSPELAVKNGTYKIEMESVVSINKGKEKTMKFFVENKKGKTYFVLADLQAPYLILEVEK